MTRKREEIFEAIAEEGRNCAYVDRRCLPELLALSLISNSRGAQLLPIRAEAFRPARTSPSVALLNADAGKLTQVIA